MNGAATQIFAREFDATFFRLAPGIQEHILRKIDAMGIRLANYPHYRMTGSEYFRLRVGDYRVIYGLEIAKNEIHLIAVGHRREVYRN